MKANAPLMAFPAASVAAPTSADAHQGDSHLVVFTYKEGSLVVLQTIPMSATGGVVSDTSQLLARCYTNLIVTVTIKDAAQVPASDSRSTGVATTGLYLASIQAPIERVRTTWSGFGPGPPRARSS